MTDWPIVTQVLPNESRFGKTWQAEVHYRGSVLWIEEGFNLEQEAINAAATKRQFFIDNYSIADLDLLHRNSGTPEAFGRITNFDGGLSDA